MATRKCLGINEWISLVMHDWISRCRLKVVVFILCGFMLTPVMAYGDTFLNISLAQGLSSDSLSHGQNLINLSPLYLLVAAAGTSLDMAKVVMFKKDSSSKAKQPKFSFIDHQSSEAGQLEYIACDNCLKNTG